MLRPLLRFRQGGRAALRSTKLAIPNEVITRVELEWAKENSPWRLIPFLEARRDVDNGLWSRLELGGELGFQPWSWLYLGQGFHQAWRDPGDNDLEWEIRALLVAPLPWSVGSGGPLQVYALNEYTVNLTEGEGQRNETGVGLRVPLPWRPLHAAVGWRHVDLIHRADMDQLEGSLTVQF